MRSVHDICLQHVFMKTKKGKIKKLGRVHVVLFHPHKPCAVGVLVKQPDKALMFKRNDCFVALDFLHSFDGGLVFDSALDGSFGKENVCKSLNLNYDDLLLWDGLNVRTEDGKIIGTVKNIFLDSNNSVTKIDVSSGSIDRKLVGASCISKRDLIGFKDGCIQVTNEGAINLEEGGVVSEAAVVWTKGKASVSKAATKAASNASATLDKAVGEGAFNAGKKIAKIKKKAKKTFSELNK